MRTLADVEREIDEHRAAIAQLQLEGLRLVDDAMPVAEVREWLVNRGVSDDESRLLVREEIERRRASAQTLADEALGPRCPRVTACGGC